MKQLKTVLLSDPSSLAAAISSYRKSESTESLHTAAAEKLLTLLSRELAAKRFENVEALLLLLQDFAQAEKSYSEVLFSLDLFSKISPPSYHIYALIKPLHI